MPSVKVLVVHYRHKPGGYSHRLRMKIEAFLQEGWEVHYIAVEPYPYSHPNLVPHILWSPTPRFDTPLFWAWFFLVCPLYTLKVGLNIRPHLISVFSPPYGWICRLLKRLGKIPMAVFLRTVPNESLYSYRQAGWANRIEHGLNAGGYYYCPGEVIDVQYTVEDSSGAGGGGVWRELIFLSTSTSAPTAATPEE